VIPFAYPYDRDYDMLKLQIEKLMGAFGVNWQQVYEAREKLNEVREKVWQLDRMTWQENLVSGWDNHYYQVCCSDFNGNPEQFNEQVGDFLSRAKDGVPKRGIRLGYIGVPPICDDLYAYLEEREARVVYNETQRQFTIPSQSEDFVEQYRKYTYPYGIFYRLEDIEREIERRSIDGIIHYAQSFCFRQIEDLIIRERLSLPVLTLEGDMPNILDARTRMRLDAFLEMLR